MSICKIYHKILAYDTEGIYKLPETGNYMILIFHKESDTNIDSNIFTTIRRRTDEKEKYYRENIGKIFTLEIENKQQNS